MAKRRHDSLQEFTGINITPLMDLTFLLLIVFMITAPLIEYSVDVSPPELEAETIEDSEDLLINLTREGEIILDERRLNLNQLAEQLRETFSARPDTGIMIRGHEDRPYREVMDIMRTARNTGFTRVALITRGEEE